MSSVNYSLNHKGVRLISSEKVWICGKKGKRKLNPDYVFVGKMDLSVPHIIISASENRQPTFKGDFGSLNKTAKTQVVKHFYDNKGKRNNKRVAYFGFLKRKEK